MANLTTVVGLVNDAFREANVCTRHFRGTKGDTAPGVAVYRHTITRLLAVSPVVLVLVTIFVVGDDRGFDSVEAEEPTASARNVVGNAGCSASACHGGAPTLADGACSANAYTNWALTDPHGHAYQVLFNDRSKAITRELKGNLPAHQDERCLACHVTPELAGSDTPDEMVALRRDGVGCEACHGPARDWLTSHASWGDANSKKEQYAKSGMRWLNDSAPRAANCAGCHVGAPADPARGIPQRDVDHDLIAAGHPRLSFEMLTYQRSLPPHWKEYDRSSVEAGSEPSDVRGPGLSLDVWLAGQVETTKAALALSADRATLAMDDRAVWPELAEYDCFGCHHDLQPTTWRQRPQYFDPDAVHYRGVRRPGSVMWNGWYFSLPLYKITKDQLSDTTRSWFATSNRIGPPQSIPAAATGFAIALDAWYRARPPEKDLANALEAHLEPTEGEYSRMTWVEAGQMYHALDALVRYRAQAGQPVTEGVNKSLEELRGLLRFPDQQPTGHYDSPHLYRLPPREDGEDDPVKVLKALFAALKMG